MTKISIHLIRSVLSSHTVSGNANDAKNQEGMIER